MKALPMTKSETVSDSTLAVDYEPRTGEVAKVPAAPLRAPRPDEIAGIAQAKTRVAKMLPRAMVNTRDGEDGSLQITHAHADGEGWSAQLQSAFGSPSKEFVHHTMAKLLNVICPAGTPLDQDTVNAALAVVDGVKPRDETEALLACQMAASHALAMECLLRTRHTDSLQRFEANGNMATKFLRTFAVQMETLARVRRGGKQKVVVEHVHVYPGGKAAVGTFNQQQLGGGGGEFEIEGQAHAITGPDALALFSGSVRSENPQRQPMPDVAGDGKEPLPDARRRPRKRRA
jgi:hypothetical protein